MFHADGRTNKHEEDNSISSQFVNASKENGTYSHLLNIDIQGIRYLRQENFANRTKCHGH